MPISILMVVCTDRVLALRMHNALADVQRYGRVHPMMAMTQLSIRAVHHQAEYPALVDEPPVGQRWRRAASP